MKSKQILLSIGIAGIGLVASFTPGANAQVTNYNIFKEDFLTQTGPSTVTSTDWTITANLSTTSASDASTITVTAPSSTVFPLTATPGTPPSYAYRGDFATKAAMDAVFPSGAAYTFAISGGTLGSQTGVLNVPTETALPYPSAIPSFSNYTAFQNLNSALASTFSFSGFTNLTGGARSSLLFFNIINVATGATVYSQNFISPSTTSIGVPAGTLSPGTAYLADLDYSNRLSSGTTGFNGVTPFTGFDYNTGAAFTTAVPEPATDWLILAGVGSLILAVRRTRKTV